MGISGNLEIEPSNTGRNELVLTKGLYIRRGYVSPEFCSSAFGATIESEVILDYPLILVVQAPISENEHIIKIMDMAKQNKRSLLVFSKDMQDGPLSTMVYNAKKDVLGSCAVNIPFLAGKEDDFFEDVAVVTGATIIKDDGIGIGIPEIELQHFGSATKVIVTEDSTQIIEGAGTEESVEKHLNTLKYQIEKEESKHFKKVMIERLTRLNQLQATIYVGGVSEVEIGENRDLIVDSLNSARAALENGILPGGGAAMFHASKLLPIYSNIELAEENVGVQIFREAMQEAMKKIIINSVGEERVGYILEQVEQQESYMVGYNCRTEKIEDMYEAGIVDSFKVIQNVIEDAVRLSTMVIMVE